MHDDAVVAKNIVIVRDGTKILDNVSFRIGAGKITGLIGPSGSGKTTLMRAIIGAQLTTSGSLTVLGRPAGSKELRTKIGYVTQSPAVYDDLTVKQNLTYFAAILGLKATDVTHAIRAVDLQSQASQLVGSMSGGQRARVSLAVALLAEPPLLILDEPTVGLDPILRRSLWQLFGELAARGRCLLVSSHVMGEAEQCADLLLLREGKVLSHSSKKDLLHNNHVLTVEDAFLSLAGNAR